MKRVFFLVTVLAVSPLAATAVMAAEALVAVAANFASATEELARDFEKSTGHSIKATTGSTGKLYAQIKSGAPFDVLLAADAKTPALLETEGAAVAGSRFAYAIGALTLWSADPARIRGDGVEVLSAPDLRHVAIANPDLAPYGVAARETLQSLGLWESIQPRIVMGQNIGQVHSMVASSAAEVGFVALSAVIGPKWKNRGSRLDVPQELFNPINQDAVLLNHGRDNPAAVAFLDFLKTPEAHAIIRRHGYGVN